MKFKKDKPKEIAATVEELPKSHSSQSGTTYGYTVEARVDMYVPTHPIIIPKQSAYSRDIILTEKWQGISFYDGQTPFGVPIATCGHDENLFRMHGLMERTSAIAMAYTLAAQHSRSSITAVKIRICQHRLTYAHNVFHEGEPEELIEHFGKIDKLFVKQDLPSRDRDTDNGN